MKSFYPFISILLALDIFDTALLAAMAETGSPRRMFLRVLIVFEVAALAWLLDPLMKAAWRSLCSS